MVCTNYVAKNEKKIVFHWFYFWRNVYVRITVPVFLFATSAIGVQYTRMTKILGATCEIMNF